MELPGEDTVKDVLRETNRQGGPIALLAVMVTGAMLAGIAAIGWMLVPALRDYVVASAQTLDSNAKSFADLSQSMKVVHEAHASMMESTEATQAAVALNGEKIELLQQSVDQMGMLIAEAKTIMANVPAQRAEQTRLQQIDEAIRRLAEELRKPPG